MVKVMFASNMWRVKRVAGIPLSKESIRSLTQAAKDVVNGEYAPPNLVTERLRICNTCPHGGTKCSLCGCFTKSKTALLNSQCPIHKWPSASDTGINTSEHETTGEQTNEIV